MPRPPKPESILIKLLIRDRDLQPRDAIDPALVDEYAAAMDRGERFPPCEAIQAEEAGTIRYYLYKGHHRVAAEEKRGKKKALVLVKDGTRREAVLAALASNRTNGSRMSNAEKRRAVLAMLADPEWSQWSNRAIAAHIGVSESLVREHRESSNCVKTQLPRQVMSLDGKVRTVPSPKTEAGTTPNSAIPVPAPEDGARANRLRHDFVAFRRLLRTAQGQGHDTVPWGESTASIADLLTDGGLEQLDDDVLEQGRNQVNALVWQTRARDLPPPAEAPPVEPQADDAQGPDLGPLEADLQRLQAAGHADVCLRLAGQSDDLGAMNWPIAQYLKPGGLSQQSPQIIELLRAAVARKLAEPAPAPTTTPTPAPLPTPRPEPLTPSQQRILQAVEKLQARGETTTRFQSGALRLDTLSLSTLRRMAPFDLVDLAGVLEAQLTAATIAEAGTLAPLPTPPPAPPPAAEPTPPALTYKRALSEARLRAVIRFDASGQPESDPKRKVQLGSKAVALKSVVVDELSPMQIEQLADWLGPTFMTLGDAVRLAARAQAICAVLGENAQIVDGTDRWLLRLLTPEYLTAASVPETSQIWRAMRNLELSDPRLEGPAPLPRVKTDDEGTGELRTRLKRAEKEGLETVAGWPIAYALDMLGQLNDEQRGRISTALAEAAQQEQGRRDALWSRLVKLAQSSVPLALARGEVVARGDLSASTRLRELGALEAAVSLAEAAYADDVAVGLRAWEAGVRLFELQQAAEGPLAPWQLDAQIKGWTEGQHAWSTQEPLFRFTTAPSEALMLEALDDLDDDEVNSIDVAWITSPRVVAAVHTHRERQEVYALFGVLAGRGLRVELDGVDLVVDEIKPDEVEAHVLPRLVRVLRAAEAGMREAQAAEVPASPPVADPLQAMLVYLYRVVVQVDGAPQGMEALDVDRLKGLIAAWKGARCPGLDPVIRLEQTRPHWRDWTAYQGLSPREIDRRLQELDAGEQRRLWALARSNAHIDGDAPISLLRLCELIRQQRDPFALRPADAAAAAADRRWLAEVSNRAQG